LENDLTNPQIISRSRYQQSDTEYYHSQQFRTESSLTQQALEVQKLEADKFWNGKHHFKNLKRNEWETMDFYDQQMRSMDAPAEEPSIHSHNSLTRKSSLLSRNVSGLSTPSPTKMARYAPSHALATTMDGLVIGKKEERLLKEAAKVKRVKKVKLNMLYFSSQCKDLIFPGVNEKQQETNMEEPAVPATPSRCESRDRSNS